MNVCGAVQYIDTAAAELQLIECAVARYNDISSKADHGDIFIRAAAGQMCPKQDFIVVPPPSNVMKVIKKKKKNTIGVKIEL